MGEEEKAEEKQGKVGLYKKLMDCLIGAVECLRFSTVVRYH